MTYIWTTRMRITRHMYVAYVQNVTGVCHILDMVATRELQFCIEKKCYVTYRLYDTHAHCTTYVSCIRAELDRCVLHTGHGSDE